MLTRVVVCSGMAAARLLELRLSRRNVRSAGASQEGTWSRRSFPLMVALHAGVIGGTLLWGRSRPRWGLLGLLLALQPLRCWVLLSLGARWNARGAVPAQIQVVTTGPYAFVRHPNYSVVAGELATLPAAFGLDALAVVATLLNAALLTIRVREEEALLFELSGYAAHFGLKRRFLPGIV